MSYKDLQVHNLADSMAYGLIPEDIYLRKIQSTPMPEDPDQIDKHIRSLLIDYRCDDPWLASDENRDPSDRGGGTHSRQFLNLRHFGTPGDESDPYLPDGTFLDHVFMERDPRGIATGPDMRKHMEQQYERASLIKFYNDDDWSVPEEGINPVKMVENIKSGMYQFKDRYKNFEESMDGWHNGGIAQSGRPWGVTLDNYTTDGTIKDLADAPQGNRRDAVAKLSGDPTVAFRYVVPDHRFNIAHYGMVRVNQDKNYQNWNNNRSSTFVDHANMAIIEGELVNRGLAHLIVDLQGQREAKQVVAQGAQFNDSAVNQMARKKLDPADIYKVMRIAGFTSQPKSAHESFEGKRIARYGKKPMNNPRQTAVNVQVNHEIANSMQQATRKIKEKNVDGFKDLRENIEKSAADEGVYRQANTRRMTEKMRSSNETRNVEGAHHIDDGKETMNYGGIAPMKDNKKMEHTDWERFGSHSLNTVERMGKRSGAAMKGVDDHEQEQDPNQLDFGIYDKANKADSREHMGRQLHYLTDNSGIEDSEQVREIDITAFNLV